MQSTPAQPVHDEKLRVFRFSWHCYLVAATKVDGMTSANQVVQLEPEEIRLPESMPRYFSTFGSVTFGCFVSWLYDFVGAFQGTMSGLPDCQLSEAIVCASEPVDALLKLPESKVFAANFTVIPSGYSRSIPSS